MPPLSLSCIAAVTPPKYNITIIDENVEAFTCPAADLVGITGYTSAINRGYQIAAAYRQRGIPVVMGGIHVSMLPDEALNYCDSVVTGEAEEIWPKVLEDFESGKLNAVYEGRFADIASLPLPRRDLLQPNYTWGTLQTSRGCPMGCNFCSVTAFNGRRFRRRKLDHVISELQRIRQKYVFLIDDNILGFSSEDRAWTAGFFSKIKSAGIKKYFLAQSSIQIGEDRELLRLAHEAGLKTLFIGMESVEGRTLESLNKAVNASMLRQNRYFELIETIRKCGIAVLGAFILGSDTDTIQSFKATYDFIWTSGIDIVQLTKPTPLPGTGFYRQLDRENRIIDKRYPSAWDEYRFTRMLFEPKNMTIGDVYEGFAWFKSRFYSRPVKFKRYLRTLIDTGDPVSAVMAYKIGSAYEHAFRSSELFGEFDTKRLNEKFEGARKRRL